MSDSLLPRLEELSGRLLEALRGAPSATAWELKLRLKAPLSHVYMALGLLARDGRIRLSPEGLTYRVQAAPDEAFSG